MKIKLSFFIILSVLSCGIPTVSYVAPPVSLDSTDYYSLNFNVDVGDITNYSINLYARYYIDTSNSKKFTESEYDDANNKGKTYLKYNDFHSVFVVSSDDGNIEDYAIPASSELSIFTENNTQVKLEHGDEELILRLNYKNLSSGDYDHNIGLFTDADGINFLNEFAKNSNSGNISGGVGDLPSVIYIEFAIIAKGLDSSTVTNSESIPVYLGTIEIQRS